MDKQKYIMIGQGTYGCVYRPSIPCFSSTKHNKKGKKYVSKIIEDEKEALSEIRSSKILKKSNAHKQFFVLVSKSCKIKYKDLTPEMIESCSLLKQKLMPSSTYVNLMSPYVDHHPMMDVLLKYPDSYSIVSRIFRIINHLYDGLAILESSQLCHFDLSLSNIIIDKKDSLPRIIDFGMAIYAYDTFVVKRGKVYLNKEKVSYFFSLQPTDRLKYAPEIQIICWYVYNRIPYDSQVELEDLESIIENHMYESQFHNIFDPDFVNNYRKECFEFLKKYRGVKVEKMILSLLQYIKTWDQYSLSAIMLMTINMIKVSKTHEDKHNLLIPLQTILKSQVRGNPNYRKASYEMKKEVSRLLQKLPPNTSLRYELHKRRSDYVHDESIKKSLLFQPLMTKMR